MAALQPAHLHEILGAWLVDGVATTKDLPGFHRLRFFVTTDRVALSRRRLR